MNTGMQDLVSITSMPVHYENMRPEARMSFEAYLYTPIAKKKTCKNFSYN